MVAFVKGCLIYLLIQYELCKTSVFPFLLVTLTFQGYSLLNFISDIVPVS